MRRIEVKPSFVSLFAGGGGSTCGYAMAGFQPLLELDLSSVAIETLQANFANHTHAASDITGLQEMVEEMVGDIEPPGCNIVIGEEEW